MGGVSVGAMDRYITLQTAVKTQSSTSGATVTDWTTGAVNIFAQWLAGGTKEAYYAQQRLEATIDGVFRIHYRTPLPTAAGSRIVWNGLTYDVLGVAEEGRQAALLLTVRAKADA